MVSSFSLGFYIILLEYILGPLNNKKENWKEREWECRDIKRNVWKGEE